MIKAIIFDCFGVIRVDSLVAAYESLGGDFAADRDFVVRAIDAANAGKIPSSSPIVAEKLGVSEEAWIYANQHASTLNQEVLDYVLELRKTYKTGLLSNISNGGLERWFEAGLLDTYFDISVASGDIGYAKPEAQAYEYVADKLGVRINECVFIDDRQEYVDGATGVGMQALLFTSTSRMKKGLAQLLNKRVK
jgi:HAD superfamily hydrolase (TIGR01549 family)